VAGICGGSRRPFRAPRSGTSASPGAGSAGCSGDAVVLRHRGTPAPIWNVGSPQFPEGPICWGGGDPPPASGGGQDYSPRCRPGVSGCAGWELQRSGRGDAISRIPGLALCSSATPEFVLSPRPEPRVRTRGYSPRPRWGHGKYAIAGRAICQKPVVRCKVSLSARSLTVSGPKLLAPWESPLGLA
jgi:hypothetical protein